MTNAFASPHARHDPRAMYRLSTGEELWLVAWGTLGALEDGIRILSKTLGRTPHYRKKNRSSIERLDEDLRLIEAERTRRNRLSTLTLCGLEMMVERVYLYKDGSKAYEFSVTDGGLALRGWGVTQKLLFTRDQVREMIARGGIWRVDEDPLNAAPWTVLDFDPE